MSFRLGLQALQLAVLTQVGCIATVDLFLASNYLVLPLERCRISLAAFYKPNKEGSFLHEISQSSFVLSVLPSPSEIRGSTSVIRTQLTYKTNTPNPTQPFPAMDESASQCCDDLPQEHGPPNAEEITIHVHPTTGGQFSVNISSNETAEELRRRISRRLQTPKERLKVLFKEQVLETKPLKDYKISDGSKVTLLPSIESGFSSTVQGTQQSIIQAIESLSDPQIDDFLSGRLPLTLALRVGDHMMFVQLQLEQSQTNAQSGDSRSSRSHQCAGSSHLRRIAQSSQRCISPRLFADMSAAPPVEAATFLPEEFHGKKSSVSRSHMGPMLAEPVAAGPASKVPKLATKADPVEAKRDYLKAPVFHQHSAPSSPDEMPYPIFNPRFNSLQHTHYNQLASHISSYNHPQSGTNHLHQLVTACSSLEQVVTIPPHAAAEPIKISRTLHENHTPRRSSRKRPSTLMTTPRRSTNVPQQASPSKSTYPDAVSNHSLPSPAAFIHNALLHHPLGGFPPLSSMISSAYANYQASRNDPNQASTSSSSSSSPTEEIKLQHPIPSDMLRSSPPSSSASSMMQAITKHHNSARADRHHNYHRRSTNARLTSGTLSHHATGLSGNRVARQMQRLRRLCGSHQQCVAYSSRELASEITSIVHMAKHHSRSDGSSHRKVHKACKECHGRDRPSGSLSGTTPSSSTTQRNSGIQASGACIDSFTTHGPGIFSGTFSGSLHPSIQDSDGKPKRDPKTILQILTDLLTATQQYQGQLGNVGLLPQIFKDHFKSDSAELKPREETKLTKGSMEYGNEAKPQPPRTVREDTLRSIPVHQHRSDYRPAMVARNNNTSGVNSKAGAFENKQRKQPPPAQYLSSVSTIPIGNLPITYATKHSSSRSSRKNSINHDGAKHRHHAHHHCRHLQHLRHHGAERCCNSLNCRRVNKLQATASASTNKRENENTNTKNKMKELMKKMQQQRRRRQNRRTNGKTCTKRSDDVTEENKEYIKSPITVVHKQGGREVLDSASTAAVDGGNVEVPFDDIKDYDIKEVGHESPETVTA